MAKAWLWWSSGKDSAWTLHLLRQRPHVEVSALVTTVNERFDRVAMHAVRSELVRAQARAVGAALHLVEIPHPCPNDVYEAAFRTMVERAREHDVTSMAFGDLYLDDVRRYREGLLANTGIEPLFPLWGRNTRELAEEMIEGGLRATITCLDPKVVPRELAGRDFDASFLADLPRGVDPLGERGEFHTFAWAGPVFSTPVSCAVGEVSERDGFEFADVLPSSERKE